MKAKHNKKCNIQGCDYKAEIKKLCKYHYWDQLRKKSKKLNSGIKKILISTSIHNRGKIKTKLYADARKEYLETHRCCETKLEGCLIPTINSNSKGLQIHHKKGRIGELLFDKKYFLAVCQNCHNYIENNPEFAILNGYSLSRLAKQDDVED